MVLILSKKLIQTAMHTCVIKLKWLSTGVSCNLYFTLDNSMSSYKYNSLLVESGVDFGVLLAVTTEVFFSAEQR